MDNLPHEKENKIRVGTRLRLKLKLGCVDWENINSLLFLFIWSEQMCSGIEGLECLFCVSGIVYPQCRHTDVRGISGRFLQFCRLLRRNNSDGPNSNQGD